MVARGQQPVVPVVGLLGAGSAQGFAAEVAAVRQGLGELGFIEGQNLTIEYRWAEDKYDRLPALADDLVSRRVAAIVTVSGTATALQRRRRRPRSLWCSRSAAIRYGPAWWRA
jgi:putative ABC transport system substrate-binding protein